MRYPPGQKARTREAIVEAAGQMFRERGYRASNIRGVMQQAGLTVGGFYNHFESKEDLLAATLPHIVHVSQEMHRQGIDQLPPREWLRVVIDRYLSHEHLELLRQGLGCPMPAITSEIARESRETRAVFENEFRASSKVYADKLRECDPGLSEEEALDRVIATFGLLKGGATLASAVADHDFCDRILKACREMAYQQIPPEMPIDDSEGESGCR